MQMRLWSFLNSGFNAWLAEDHSLVVVKLGDGRFNVDWPRLGRPVLVCDQRWVIINLDLDLDGVARKVPPDQLPGAGDQPRR